MAPPVRKGSARGRVPSVANHTRANRGNATTMAPTVVASGGLSSPMRFIPTRLADEATTAPSSAHTPAVSLLPADGPSCTKIKASPAALNSIPPIFIGVRLRSPSQQAANTPATSGDSPNSTEISPEPTWRAPQ